MNSLSLIQWRGSHLSRDRQGAESPGPLPDGRGSDRMERFWAPGERLNWKLGSISATLAGDLNPAELHRIAQSIRPLHLRGDPLIAKK